MTGKVFISGIANRNRNPRINKNFEAFCVDGLNLLITIFIAFLFLKTEITTYPQPSEQTAAVCNKSVSYFFI